jgi:hypothetical protein
MKKGVVGRSGCIVGKFVRAGYGAQAVVQMCALKTHYYQQVDSSFVFLLLYFLYQIERRRQNMVIGQFELHPSHSKGHGAKGGNLSAFSGGYF